jgi:hypothetical protein
MPDSRNRFEVESLWRDIYALPSSIVEGAPWFPMGTLVEDGIETVPTERSRDSGITWQTLTNSFDSILASEEVTFRTNVGSWGIVAGNDSGIYAVSAAPAREADPSDWYGSCGHLRCYSCYSGARGYYRDRGFTQLIPGTYEERGYRLVTMARPGTRKVRFWQANSERRARAWHMHFYPTEKIVGVRRAHPARTGRGNRRTAELYVPEQVNVMLPGVAEPQIDPVRIY